MESPALSRIRTLLVDDFGPFRRFLLSILQQRPEIDIIGEARTGIEAVQLAQELQPDVILLDISLPHLSGIEAARRIRTLSPRSKIIFITLTGNAAVVQKAFEAGGVAYIVKTHARREVLPAIDAVLRGETFLGTKLAVPDSPRPTCEPPLRPE